MFHFFARILFLGGFLFGFLFAILLTLFQPKTIKPSQSIKSYLNRSLTELYDTWFAKQDMERKDTSVDAIRYGNVKYLTESQYLFDKIQVLCLILVRNVKNAEAANKTWVKQCNQAEFIHITTKNKIKLPIRRTKDNASWPLLCKSLQNLSGLFKWILIINDNMFAIIENVRYLVAALDYTKEYYLGHAMTFWGVTYNSGQAGYLISNGTLTAIKKTLNTSESCNAASTFWNLEDYYLGKTLANLNISPSDTRDGIGLTTFHGFNLLKLHFPGSTLLSNYYKFSLYPTKCCSSHAVTFQVTEGDKMYTYDYLLRQLQVFKTGTLGNKPPTTPKPEKEVWMSFLKEQNITDSNISVKKYYNLWLDVIDDSLTIAQNLYRNKTDVIA